LKTMVMVLIIILSAATVSNAGYGDSLDLYLKEAGYYLSANDFPKSLRLYQRALDFDSASVNALTNIGILFSLKGAHDSSLYYLGQALDYDSNDASIYNSMGIEYIAIGDTASALFSYQQAIGLADDNADFFLNAGILLISLNRFEEATEHLVKAFGLDSTDAEINYNLGNSYMARKMNKPAEKYLENAVKFDSLNNINYLYNLGLVKLNVGKFEEAESSLIRITTSNPNHFDSHLRLGMAYAMQKKFEPAIDMFQKCVALDAKSDEAMIFLGASHYYLNHMTESEEIYNYLKENSPEAAEKMMNLINPQGR